ncbi:6,7-dimethyl-8-ribityllumazine synthase [Fructilactobacillus myrtifloralis]|uniref:6,7-dimethyl-8-ribityllumazine synthase n=1 Tax=Fructilactobacillus myrtifloralis TaxID=2940301 RepID=A0ABY5BNF2_9LACO|nr:6,7-dimethyl-8-ribityllumazine synthase [Fructilactobacillus myrtifloralis]USS85112.1 6,7-dimethyl-8-ribityllumazine synthase [Fructilactobacillus myrtifloralis]
MEVKTGSLNGQHRHVGIVVAKFNQLVTQKLLDGTIATLQQCGVAETDIQVYWVPGAFEIPRVAKLVSETGKVDGVIALGAVVRGATSHYDYVCAQTAAGIAQVSLTSPVPVLFGVLTTDDMAQALDRAGGKAGNKGSECAQGLLEMISVEAQI